MKITKYKFSCVSWKTGGDGKAITETQKLDEKHFTNDDILEARREGVRYLTTHLENIIALEKSLKDTQKFPPLVYHLRLYFLREDGIKFSIFSIDNYDVEGYSQDRLNQHLDHEVSLYLENGYNLGGEIHMLQVPGKDQMFKVLYDTALEMQKQLQRMESEEK